MRFHLLLLGIILSIGATSQSISTADIDHFWQAYDQLATAQSKEDSIGIIQRTYIDRATPGFKEFLRVRKFTADEYVKVIGAAPKFWQSIRPLTKQIAQRIAEIETVLAVFVERLPKFKTPDVCFAIGTLRTGGTTTSGLILIGSDIAAADETVDTSELNNWLKSVLGKTGDIVAMVAHEAVHTQQKGSVKSTVLTASMGEGIADFITQELLGVNINAAIHDYGLANECQLWREFQAELHNPDYSKWLYGGSGNAGRPADLGYFMGFQIAKAYYEKSSDKRVALTNLLNRRSYEEIYKESGYTGGCSD